MNWQKLTFTNDEIAFGVLDKILRQFLKTLLKLNTPMEKVCVFASTNDDNATISLFFSPNATNAFSSILTNYEPSPCSQPSEDEIAASFFFGDKRCWEILS